MYYKAIRNGYLYSRAIKKVCKKRGISLNISEVNRLYVFSKWPKVFDASKILSKAHHHEAYYITIRNGRKLASLGFCTIENEGYGISFPLTLEGRNFLAAVERQLRNERPDK